MQALLFIGIYLVGYVLAFVIIRQTIPKPRNMSDFQMCVFFSLASWLGVIVFPVIALLDYLDSNKQPPKWFR